MIAGRSDMEQEFLAYVLSQRMRMRARLVKLRSGQSWTSEMHNGEQIDTTSETLRMLEGKPNQFINPERDHAKNLHEECRILTCGSRGNGPVRNEPDASSALSESSRQ